VPHFNTCIILCRFRNGAAGLAPIPRDRDFYRDYFFTHGNGGLSDYLHDVANGRVTVGGEVFGWFDIGHDLAEQAKWTRSTQNSSSPVQHPTFPAHDRIFRSNPDRSTH
jgi:hypothetical protein